MLRVGWTLRGGVHHLSCLTTTTLHHSHHPCRYHTQEEDYSAYYRELGLSEGSNQAAVREAYLRLVKLHHPDTTTAANTDSFHRVEHAYRRLVERFSRERSSGGCEGEYGLYYEQKRRWRDEQLQQQEEEDEDKDDYRMKHKGPQHRHYLSHDGVGVGTPGQRARAHTRVRAQRAASGVLEYRVRRINEEHSPQETNLQLADRRRARKIRTRYGIDRMVDDMIQEAMARGDFDNLSLAGRPLPQRTVNPYVDTTTQKINEHLINNGFAPEWVVVEREVRQARQEVRQRLRQARSRLGPLPLSPQEQAQWEEAVGQIRASHVVPLNQHINKLNLLVPLLAQQVTHFPLAREAERALREGPARGEGQGEGEGEGEKGERHTGGHFIFRLLRRWL